MIDRSLSLKLEKSVIYFQVTHLFLLLMRKPGISSCTFVQTCSIMVFTDSQLFYIDLLLSWDFYFMKRLERGLIW